MQWSRLVGCLRAQHEPPSRCKKVSDESPEQRHLAPKHDAHLAARELAPEQLLGRRKREAHLTPARLEQRDAAFAGAMEQGLIVGSSHAPNGAGGVPAPTETRRTSQGWRAACALSHDSKRQQARAVATIVGAAR